MTEQAPNQPPSQPQTGLNLSRPAIVSIAMLASFVLPFTSIVGVVLAYIWRRDDETQEWEVSHFSYQIRTFWMGLLFFVGSMIVWFASFFAVLPENGAPGGEPPAAFFVVFFGIFFVWLVLAAWFCARCVMSLAKTSKSQPMPNPKSWLL